VNMMSKITKRMLIATAVLLPVIAYATMYYFSEHQYRQKKQLLHQRFIEFDSAIRPVLRSDQRFEKVYLGEYTGGGRGALGGFVDSTNDLENLRQIYVNTLSNHSAAVGFYVKVSEANSN